VDVELLEVADDHAGVLPGDVTENHVAVGLLGRGVQMDDVQDRRRSEEQLEGLVGNVRRSDDPEWIIP
jgi:hypothetical protein